ncbi:hypothetical protein OQ435_17520 [Proteus penneri]|uniref:hypothetical protein n=1 Tax=Proteus penneri TaxID=102862 RepID=UPI002247AA6B|nr:hypothetical protein [Proteus penneri]MCX2589967.1 hypothetical protein [Proteus penneri]
MINQNLEVLVDKLSAQVVQQGQQIAELQKQLADMQKATSCDLDILSTRITAVESFSR